MKPDREISEQVAGIEFKPADGGMISETRHRTAGDKYGPSFEHKTAVHAKLSDAVAHLKKHMGGSFAKKQSPEKKSKGASMRKG